MNEPKRIVLDANILIRSVLGTTARRILSRFAESVSFCCPDVCFFDARRKIAIIGAERGFDPVDELGLLDQFTQFIAVVDFSAYSELREAALARIAVRDPDDWPIIAAALLLDAPIWTEDQDFFGCGIATWTTDRVEIYLRDE